MTRELDNPQLAELGEATPVNAPPGEQDSRYGITDSEKQKERLLSQFFPAPHQTKYSRKHREGDADGSRASFDDYHEESEAVNDTGQNDEPAQCR